MAVTLDQYRLMSTDPFEKGYVKIFVEENPIMRFLPMKKIEGSALKVRQEEELAGIEWRRVNESYTESTSRLGSRMEGLYILGGEVYIDNFEIRTQRRGGDALDLKAVQYEQKARALAREYSRAFFLGDDLIDQDEMVGMRRRLTGNQVLLAGAGGASLTLAMIDELLDTVIGSNVHLFMHKTLRRKMTTLANAAGTSVQITYSDINQLGKQIRTYDGVPIHVIEDRGNGASYLGFVEDPGDGTQDTASIYAINMDEDEGVFGIYNGDGPMVEVKDFGETEADPGHLGRIEMFTGLGMGHPRGAGRLRGVLAA